jgi:hypothetical protein
MTYYLDLRKIHTVCKMFYGQVAMPDRLFGQELLNRNNAPTSVPTIPTASSGGVFALKNFLRAPIPRKIIQFPARGPVFAFSGRTSIPGV